MKIRKPILALSFIAILLISISGSLPIAHAVTLPIPVGRNPVGVLFDSFNKDIYVANYADNTVSVISTADNTLIAMIPGFNGPWGLAQDAEGRIYVTDFGGNTVQVMDPSTNNPFGTRCDPTYHFVPCTYFVGNHPAGIAFDPSNGDMYVANNADGTVSVIDTNAFLSPAVLPLHVGNYPTGVAFASSNNEIYVTNDGDGTVSVINAATNMVLTTPGLFPISVGQQPYGIAFAPSNGDIYVANRQSIEYYWCPLWLKLLGDCVDTGLVEGTVSVIDTATNFLIGTIATGLGSGPYGVAFSSSSNDIYVTNYAVSTVAVIAATPNDPVYGPNIQVATILPVGQYPAFLAFAPSNGDMYVANSVENDVTVLDTATNTIISTNGYVSAVVSNIQSALGSISSASITALQTSVTNGFNALSTATTNLQTSVNTLATSLSTDYTALSASISSLQTSINNLKSAESSDLSSILSAIANIGVTGPTVGTSNDATVAASTAFSTVSAFSSSSSNWVLVSPSSATTGRVVAGYSITFTAAAKMVTPSYPWGVILYVSTTNSPGSSSAAYAIPIGSLSTLGASASGQLRFPFSIPSGSPVYVQVVSSQTATVTVQLQFLNTPINP